MTDFKTEIRSLHLEEEHRPYRAPVEIETAVLAYGSKTEIPEGAKLRKNGDPDRRYLKRSPEYREYISHYMKEMYRDRPELCSEKARPMIEANTGKPWTEERKKERSELLKQYVWITNDRENKRIKKDAPLPEGWRRGRLPFSEEANRKRGLSKHLNHLKKIQAASED